jgi:hypothetical protein
MIDKKLVNYYNDELNNIEGLIRILERLNKLNKIQSNNIRIDITLSGNGIDAFDKPYCNLHNQEVDFLKRIFEQFLDTSNKNINELDEQIKLQLNG